MHDRVAEVLRQRAALDRGASAGIAVSVFLHAALAALVVYSALHASPPEQVTTLNIQFAKMPAAPVMQPASSAPKAIETPKIEEPKLKVQEPPKKPEKNTVPLSPFGRSTKKGAEEPAPAKPAPAAPVVPAVPVGGSGVAGLEGGAFPYTLYLESMQRRIGSSWFRPQVAPGTEVVVYFRINRDGTISEAKIEKPSGNGTFDRAALSAVRSSIPLNPLPFAYNGNYLGVQLIFR
ncbi:MAG TPA: TonB family protein [Thermoanaerobaculia bacterium]|nr:TonB family protein [Thermoanaerobaculia bacterium]